jgi:hypothetical protein
MSWYDTLWRRNSKGAGGGLDTIDVATLLRDYEVEYVNDDPGNQYAVVSKRVAQIDHLEGEFGTSSASPWTSFVRQEYNPALQGFKGLEVYDKMRRSDGGVRSTLRGVKTPVLAARWFVEPGGDKDIDKKAAEFVWRNLTKEMSTPWAQTLTEALLMLDFGYYMFEKVWENRVIDGEMRTVLKKLGPRHPMDVKEWHFDLNGGPRAASMYAPSWSSNYNQEIIIPIDKLLVFSFDKEAGNIEGISVLRSAYKHWYYKEQLYKIDAIQKERHGIGIPIIQLPLGFKDEDKKIAEELGRNIRTNERAHIVLPPGWELKMLKLEGQPVDCLKSIDHHDTMIRMNVLGEFFKGGQSEDDQTMFLKATRFIADIVCEIVNAYLIPQMTTYNFVHAKPPVLKVRRIGESADWRTLSFAIRNLIGAGAIVPDEPLENQLREEMDLPMSDPDTARPQVTPQAADLEEDEEEDPDEEAQAAKAKGARVGPPRQAPVGRRQNTRGVPRGNAGTDQSGGS